MLHEGAGVMCWSHIRRTHHLGVGHSGFDGRRRLLDLGPSLASAGGRVTNCLCTKHNSALHPLDDAAQYFFASLKSYLERDAGSNHALLSGHDIERWLLKTAKAAAVSKNLARGRKPLSGAFSRDAAILDMLDDPRQWPEGPGLYCIMNTGDRMLNHPRFQLQPLTNEQDDIEALALSILGLGFVLLLAPLDESRYPFLRGAKYRPGRIVISYPSSTNWLTMSWEDGGCTRH
jgi:hypothetical protein